MEKFTQAPVGLDIDQTVSSNSTAIANLDIEKVTSVTIASLCNSCPANKHKYYFIADSNGITDFPTATRMYRNYISISKFDGDNNRANVEIIGKTGADIVCPFEGIYENGTFYWQELATKSNIVKTKAISGTTSGNANLQLPLLYAEGVPIAVKLQSQDRRNVYAMLGRYSNYDSNGYWGAKIYYELSADGEAKNANVTGTLYYI